MLSPVSSTKASTTYWMVMVVSTDWIVILGTSANKDLKVKTKHKSHKNGPMVEPWPGPKSNLFGLVEYSSSDIPYSIHILWNVSSHVLG